MLTTNSISKNFGSLTALAEVSLTCAAGQVHGLLGENGAGKSTLMNILFGLVAPDTGTISLSGKTVRINSPHQAQRHGIGMVHQHFALFPSLSVVDNMMLALQPGLGKFDRQQWSAHLRGRAEKLHWHIDPLAVVGTLTSGQQQRVEIIKALLALDLANQAGVASRILILDEPTAVLTEPEVDELLPAIRQLAADGVAILYISHKLHEVARVCDVVTVLRRGRVVHHGPAATPPTHLATLMVGTAVNSLKREAQPAPITAAPYLTMKQVVIRSGDGRVVVDVANLAVRAGEMVALAGVEGNGQSELVEVLLGQRKPDAGQVFCCCEPQRLGYIPDDRFRDGLVLPLSVRDNVALKAYHKKPFSWHGWLSLRQWTKAAQLLIGAYDVRAQHVHVPVATLSGGNQQKVVIARELSPNPPVIIAVNPTRGLDVAAATAVLGRLVAARDSGAAVLLIHHDLDETLAVTDRLVVMQGGKMIATNWPDCDRAHISQVMMGLTSEAKQ
jgi:general nucleoside transport system ATP-binding protein